MNSISSSYSINEVAVVYHSTTGTTKQLAEAITEGANSVGRVRATAFPIVGKDIQEGRFINTALLEEISHAQAVIMGSPTYMGGVSAQFKAFADATSPLWAERAWVNKIAAGFTIGANYSGDQLNSIQYLQTMASQHGMLWASLDIGSSAKQGITNRLGAQGGLIARTTDSTVHDDDLGAARYMGERVARLAVKWDMPGCDDTRSRHYQIG